MSRLIIALKQGDVIIINGAPVRVRTRTELELTDKARFLFGKQVMPPEAANTPARRIYFALQTAYIGSESERAAGLALARELAAQFAAATTSGLVRGLLAEAIAEAEADNCYAALKLVRRVINHETAVTGGTGRAGAPAQAGRDAAAKHVELPA